MPLQPPPTAYSYLRCSTPEQMQGDTFRRQMALAEAYALKRGWQLDRTLTLHDMGVSAFRGRNAVEGTLGAFLEHVRSGEIAPGSVLLIESLDRLSRQEIDDALWLFLDIIRSGVTIVTLLDEMEYSRDALKGPTGSVSLIVSLFILSRAHEESATKARRLKEAWAAKRDRLAQVPLTSKVPAWLRMDRDSGTIQLVPERAAIVQRIFQEAREGTGQHQIAHGLNGDNVEPWGSGAYWHRSYIAKILSNEAAIGTFTPHTLDYESGKRTRNPKDPVKGYFPAAISEELWGDVQAMRDSRGVRSRGRYASRPVSHMLARLACCPLCGGTMARVMKGSRSRPALVCVRAKASAGCSYKSVRIDILHDAIIERLPVRLRDAPAGERNPALDKQIANLDAERGAITERMERLLEAIETGGDVRTLTERLRQLEGEYEETRDTLRNLEALRVETAGQTVQARISRLIGTLEPEKGTLIDVPRVNAAMTQVFRGVTVDYRHGVLEFEWQHGGSVELPYAMSVNLD